MAEKVDGLIGNVLASSYAVLAGGRIGLFGRDWKEQAFFGDRVTNFVRAGKTLFFSDSSGVHGIVAAAAAPGVQEELLAADACSLGTQDGTWVTFRAPCSGGPVVAVHEPTGRRYTLAFDANPQQLRLALLGHRLDVALDQHAQTRNIALLRRQDFVSNIAALGCVDYCCCRCCCCCCG